MRAEPARHDRAESVAPLILAGECSHIGTHHPYAVTPPQRCHGALEGIGGGSNDAGPARPVSSSASFVRASKKFLVAPGREAEVAVALASRVDSAADGPRQVPRQFSASTSAPS